MKETIYVNTGAIAYGGENIILNSGAIGSCIVVTVFDQENHNGAMAHIMLPGKSQEKPYNSLNKYASDAIKTLHNHFVGKSSKFENLVCCMVGGANVLCKKDDILCDRIIKSVIEWTSD